MLFLPCMEVITAYILVRRSRLVTTHVGANASISYSKPPKETCSWIVLCLLFRHLRRGLSPTKTRRDFPLPSPWFRLYHEFADDPKVQMMTEAMQRRLVMLMCFRCKDATLHATQLAFYLRISAEELAETKQVFLASDFIDEDWNLLNWNKRQFVSDSSTDRSRRSRQRKQQSATLHEDGHKDMQRNCNVAATAPDTEQKQRQKEARAAAVAFAKETAKKRDELVANAPLSFPPHPIVAGRAEEDDW